MTKYLNRFYIPVIIILLLGYTAKINWGHEQWKSVMQSDAKGYYAYLPAIFIYDDLNFQFYEEVEVTNAYDPNLVYDYRAIFKGHQINKYFIGESVLLTPFFLIAHFTSGWLGYPTDGYSQLYAISITLAALFYLLIGLIALKKTLTLYKFSTFNIFISISVIVFGTNLFYYSVGEMGVTHVYSFSMISVFIYHVSKYFQSLQSKYIIYAAFFLGIIILIRPVNAIVLLSIPFLSQSKKGLTEGLKNYFAQKKVLLGSVGIVFFIVSIQLIIYKIQTGSFLVYSYGEEGFNFASPSWINFLFSYKKGFFVYTPIGLIALFGFIYLWKDKFKFLSLVLFLSFTIYVLSSWWNWYYGGSFSSRVMVDFLPFFTILLCFVYKRISKVWVRISYLFLIFLLVLVNQVQTLQYRYYIIHWSDMDKESYWNAFLDIKPILERRDELK